MISVEVFLDDRYGGEDGNPVPAETWNEWVGSWLDVLADYLPVAPGYEIGLRLTDDREIQEYNSRYRYKDRPTDVLAFAALEVDAPSDGGMLEEPLYLGDLIISIETAREQAREGGHSLTRELAWLAAHGCLHLLGWDHPDETSLQEMLSLQENLLAGLKTNF